MNAIHQAIEDTQTAATNFSVPILLEATAPPLTLDQIALVTRKASWTVSLSIAVTITPLSKSDPTVPLAIEGQDCDGRVFHFSANLPSSVPEK